MAQSHDVETIRKETKTYLTVFGALAVLTVLTVGVSYFHLPPVLAIAVALAIAAFKGSLVAGVFMHLLHERKLIYWLLLLTVAFFLVLLFWPTLSQWDQRHL
ncbi:MAG TPA: cytochrome C oxidase subunit IV family protein [Thermoanaerobaculia bacterium]|jgi:caa(3)-type oxidase subunit IV|nr:cytochrome C oxidase subunit IV family protein [Thermoanaerobaculia bacterium]